MTRITHWGNGITSRNIFTIKLFKLRLELWKDNGNPFAPNKKGKSNK